jgi:hypothetical protein
MGWFAFKTLLTEVALYKLKACFKPAPSPAPLEARLAPIASCEAGVGSGGTLLDR